MGLGKVEKVDGQHAKWELGSLGKFQGDLRLPKRIKVTMPGRQHSVGSIIS